MRALLLALVVGCGSPEVRAPSGPQLNVNMAERYSSKLGTELHRRWYSGELRPREVNQFTIRGHFDEHTETLIATLGGHVVRPAVFELPNEALDFVLPQPWVELVDVAEGAPPAKAWTASAT